MRHRLHQIFGRLRARDRERAADDEAGHAVDTRILGGLGLRRNLGQAFLAGKLRPDVGSVEADIGRRIFIEYLAGMSSRTIAMRLNSESVPGPQGSEWGPSTIHGNPKRGTGILNN